MAMSEPSVLDALAVPFQDVPFQDVPFQEVPFHVEPKDCIRDHPLTACTGQPRWTGNQVHAPASERKKTTRTCRSMSDVLNRLIASR
jgi:hypothetical protein